MVIFQLLLTSWPSPLDAPWTPVRQPMAKFREGTCREQLLVSSRGCGPAMGTAQQSPTMASARSWARRGRYLPPRGRPTTWPSFTEGSRRCLVVSCGCGPASGIARRSPAMASARGWPCPGTRRGRCLPASGKPTTRPSFAEDN